MSFELAMDDEARWRRAAMELLVRVCVSVMGWSWWRVVDVGQPWLEGFELLGR